MQKFKSNKLLIALVSITVLMVLVLFAYIRDNSRYIDLNFYNQILQTKSIDSAQVYDDEIHLRVGFETYKIQKQIVDLKELAKFAAIETKRDLFSLSDFLSIFIFVVLILFLVLYSRRTKDLSDKISKKTQTSEELGNPLGFSADTPMPSTSKISFKDVAGIDEIKVELQEIIDFLKNPIKYRHFGINLPKGVLLIGPPGVGKTLIAKAVAGEANVPFFYQSGASFVQIYVGMGAKRVRELFARAKRFAPSIIFIDEIDAVGKVRDGLRNDEREATLNQLLTEMDGFEESSGVIVIAATNKIEMLDDALLRSGRFDRRVFVPLPNLQARQEILEVYLEGKPHEVDIQSIAKMTVGFSGASLATLVNEAAINALKMDKQIIEESDFASVYEKVLIGKHTILSFSKEEKDIQALYQAAKTLTAYWFEVDFDKMSIVSNGFKEIDREMESRSSLLSKIKVHLAGKQACKLIYNEIYTNTTDDINKAKKLAFDMVEKFGMGESYIGGVAESSRILQECEDEVYSFLEGSQKQLLQIKQLLDEQEVVTKEQIKEILEDVF
jgi:ATP-dependent metalloprotease FtsH